MKTRNTLIVSFLSLFVATMAFGEIPPTVDGKPVVSIAPMLKNVMSGIVNVSVIGEIPAVQNPFADELNGNKFRGNRQRGQSDSNGPQRFGSLGSGIIINAQQGYIVTNAHVLKDAKVITVTLKTGQQYKAKLIGADSASDIAVLQIHANTPLDALTLADSNTLQVGDFVVAIGNPFGLNQSVTSGIVSALQRNGLGIEGYEDFIQTDAPINPGNSGGALVNFQGQVVGLNTAILGPDGANIGIGFAIPSNMVKNVVQQLLKYGSVHRGLMGIMVQSVTPNLATAMNLDKSQGAIVTMVTPYSPAAKAGLKVGDIIVGVNGSSVKDAAQVTNIVGLTRVGSDMTLGLLRNNQPLQITLQTATTKAYQKITRDENPFLFGINLKDFAQLNAIHGAVRGVQVVALSQESPAAQALPTGLRPGDVIVSANSTPITDVAQLQTVANAATTQHKPLVLNILRGVGALFVVLR